MGPTRGGRATGQDAELAAGALPPLDPPDEEDPDEEDEPEDDDEDDEDEPDDDDPEPAAEDDSDFAGLLVVPPAVASEPDARESVR
ncbi:hypothetical protein AB0J84_30545 [Micromonospora arborensis]|uniref:hypothetical protein n=1 Tax=Micromonospora arborensis TaxID=2116518 RepID=UPI003416A16F